VNRNLARASLLLFSVSILLLIALTVFESGLVGLSPDAERVITFLLLIVPSGVGAVLGAQSLRREEQPRWMAITGVIVNTLFALFHLMIILFAG
jgi:hypothetical protein